MNTPKYKRILLKLSGEALAPKDAAGILDFDFIEQVAAQIKRCVDVGVQVGVIVGAGNIWRGRQGTGMDHPAGRGYKTPLQTDWEPDPGGNRLTDPGLHQ